MQESENKNEIEIKCYKYKTVLALLEFFYKGTIEIDIEDPELLLELLQISDEYLID
jgi:hypothetical protein